MFHLFYNEGIVSVSGCDVDACVMHHAFRGELRYKRFESLADLWSFVRNHTPCQTFVGEDAKIELYFYGGFR